MRYIITICFFILAFFSCTGNQGGLSDGYVAPDTTKAVNIHPTLWMYTEVDGRYLGTIDAGELVGLTDKVQKNKDNWDYTQIKRGNGQEVWVLPTYLIRGTRPGVIVKSGFIYSEPILSKLISNEKVEQYTIVAGLKDPKSGQFVQVSYMWKKDNSLNMKSKVYVKSEIVSFIDADIQATILFGKYQNEKNADAKKELLSSAVQLESPAFKQAFTTELSSLEGGAPVSDSSADAGADALDIQGTYMTTEDDVACYKGPSADSGNIGSFQKNVKLTIDKRSKEMVNLGGAKNYWYHAKDKGWVFGEYIIESGD